MGEPVAGKFLLEILTKGMYSNPMHVYREYIQNSTDSIDKAIANGLLTASEANIHIQIDGAKRKITIRDNGCGISVEKARETLLNIGHSDKNGVDERGFRGIGRLAGLAYAEEVQFITSAHGEPVKTVMTCDCVKMQQLLQKTNTETTDVMETFKAISSFEDPQPEDRKVAYKIDFELLANLFAVLRLFGSLDNADVYTVASHTKFIINYIFHGVGLLKLAEVDSCIAESQIREIVFLRGFDIRLSLDVITLSRFDQERVLKAVQIFLDGFRGDFGFLNGLEGIAQLFGIGQRTDRRGKDIQKIFQFTDISDFIALANITDINLAEKILQSRSFVTGIISQNHKRDTAVKHT